MADKLKADDEPSIEDILDSIRQIIAEDDKPASATTKPAPKEEIQTNDSIDDIFASVEAIEAESAPATILSNEDDDIFELTEHAEAPIKDDLDITSPDPFLDDFDKIVIPEEPEFTEPEDEPFVVDLIDEPENIPSPEPAPEPVVESVPVPQQQRPETPVSHAPVIQTSDSILSEAAEKAAMSAISELARKTAIEHSGITIEEIVRSELKPLLRAWLDKNLPVVIERLVREELERVTKRVLED